MSKHTITVSLDERGIKSALVDSLEEGIVTELGNPDLILNKVPGMKARLSKEADKLVPIIVKNALKRLKYDVEELSYTVIDDIMYDSDDFPAMYKSVANIANDPKLQEKSDKDKYNARYEQLTKLADELGYIIKKDE